MPKRVQRIGHDTATAAAFTGLERETTVDLGKKSIRVHDGLTPGGKEIARADLTNVPTAIAGNNAGKMSSQQATDLVQALNDISALITVITPITTGTTTAYTINLGMTAYTLNAVYEIRIHSPNSVSNGTTINFDGIGALSVKLVNGINVIAGQLGDIAKLLYDGTNLVLLTPKDVAICAQIGLTANTAILVSDNQKTVPLDAVTIDVGGFYNNTTFRYTPLIAGVYKIDFSVTCSSGTNVNLVEAGIDKVSAALILLLRFTSVNYSAATSSNIVTTKSSALVRLNGINEFIECYARVYDNSSTIRGVIGTQDYSTYLLISRVGD